MHSETLVIRIVWVEVIEMRSEMCESENVRSGMIYRLTVITFSCCGFSFPSDCRGAYILSCKLIDQLFRSENHKFVNIICLCGLYLR